MEPKDFIQVCKKKKKKKKLSHLTREAAVADLYIPRLQKNTQKTHTHAHSVVLFLRVPPASTYPRRHDS
jgi:hypothetical protein